MESKDDKEPSIGGRLKNPKTPNLLKAQAAARAAAAAVAAVAAAAATEEQAGGEEGGDGEEEEQAAGAIPIGRVATLIPPFGDNSEIFRDGTTSGLITDPINQYLDTCSSVSKVWEICGQHKYSVVFARLLQISYNKDKPVAQRRTISWRDLAEYIRSKTKKNTYAFGNMNIPIKYIRHPGVRQDDQISGGGVKTQGDFDRRQDATRDFVYQTLESTPLGIVVGSTVELENVGTGIYHIPSVPNDALREHAMLVVARGVRNDGVSFLVAQNSWGEGFGNNGYCRLFLPNDGVFKIFWPL